ncbi:hypothetical protein DFH05DRAFT_1529107 [Lentinula detonsa]|uniref:F-box domain-containing protein n=1 Tax=Lentinula detonsa TaxID=2804962 RepID=A0A9W8NTI1_9AGAR|nr:hypothetical protein DFH05DRAFT_1529107 [Lentinula detonsa]
MARRSERLQGKKDALGEPQMQEMTVGTVLDSIGGLKRARDEENNQDYDEDPDDNDGESPKRKRKRSKKAVSAKSSVPSSGTDEQPPKPSTKRQRMPEEFRKVRGKLGLLERLAKDVPLDVILEVFCYLDPGDLLRLARTSKDLRGILMSKTSESIWCIARGNVEGLPPCPVDLNEPQYAHLLFESYCHICMHSGRRETILWKFRMRSCKRCLWTFPSAYIDNAYYNDHPLSILYRHLDILPRESVQRRSSHRREQIGHTEIAERYKTEYDALETEDDRKAWLTRKSQERLAIANHSELCESWHRTRLEVRADELNDIRMERKEAILTRLEEIGWRAEAEKIMDAPFHRIDPFSDHKSVKQSKKLTDHGWHYIKDELVKLLSDHKAARLAQERSRLLSSRVSSFQKIYNVIFSEYDLRNPFPSIGDIFINKVFEALIWDTPEDEALTDATIRSKLLEHLPSIIAEWRAAKIQELVEIMKKSHPTATADDLHLATTVFECKACYGNPLYYPQMFYHRCCIHNRNLRLNNERVLPFICDGPWTSTSIDFSDRYSNRARTIVEACSVDPTTTTFNDICAANPLIECLTCKRDPPVWDAGRYFMRWPLPILHDSGHDLNVNNLGEEEGKNIVAFEPSIRSESCSPICCAYCHKEQTTSISSLVLHLKDEHIDIIDLEEVKDCYKLQELQQHWYWNPRISLRWMGQPFRYKELPQLTEALE